MVGAKYKEGELRAVWCMAFFMREGLKPLSVERFPSPPLDLGATSLYTSSEF